MVACAIQRERIQGRARGCMCIIIIYKGVMMGDAVTYECFIEFVVRGHHVCKAVWNPVIRET